ncbi:MAG: hypothetical protein ACE5EC_06205, partial [Phycisphaerae bacterium]
MWSGANSATRGFIASHYAVVRSSLTVYRKNLLRFGIALGLLLVAAYLFSVRTPGQTQDGWQRLRRALV